MAKFNDTQASDAYTAAYICRCDTDGVWDNYTFSWASEGKDYTELLNSSNSSLTTSSTPAEIKAEFISHLTTNVEYLGAATVTVQTEETKV